MEVTLPFSGFYGSRHDAALDDAMEQEFENIEERNAALDKVMWSFVHHNYAKEYAEQFFHTFKITGASFLRLVCPKEYNFETDRIFVDIPIAEMVRIHNQVLIHGNQVWEGVCREALAPRSGFIPFHSQDPEDWGPVAKWSPVCAQLLIQTWVELTIGDNWDVDKEDDLMEPARCNGRIEGWIHSSMSIQR